MAYKLAGFTAKVIHEQERPKSICISIDGRRIYLPKSQVRKKELVAGDEYRLVIPKWLADQKQIKDAVIR